MMARAFELSRSGYYAWFNRTENQRTRENRFLTQRIREIHVETLGIYGVPCIHTKLKAEGYKANKKTSGKTYKSS